MNLTVKTPDEKDLPRLFDLYTQLIGKEGDYASMLRVYGETRDDPHYTLFGVYSEGELIATASVTRCFDLTGDARYYYNMENFVVDEKYRNMGVGSFLLEKIEKFAEENNASYINFTSSSERTEAHRFYVNNAYDIDAVKGFKKHFEEKQ